MTSGRDGRTGYLYIAPWLIGFLLLTAGPMCVSLYLSTTSWTMLTPPVQVGFRNYAAILTDDPIFTVSLLNTLV
ncbi:hypothetical protein PLCT1_01882 [Planctomycetaceae bacterium]|nr:hypothetical protein PLCT1_01882 [Planctomycetaceae bacterium]